MHYPFTKMQAVGNDFVVVEATTWPVETDWSPAAIFLCDRRFGIGGDGLLLVLPSSVAGVRMRMFNPDGTEDMCGNGLRCVAAFAHDRGRLTPTPSEEFLLESIVGVHRATRSPEGLWAIEMGQPEFAPAQIPMSPSGTASDRILEYPLEVDDETIIVSSISTGSTHTVLFVEALPTEERFQALSPRIEHHPAFPERTSVIWAVPAGDSDFTVRIWERGAGETLGCGTGACAVGVLAQVTGRVSSDEVAVASKGGTLRVRWDKETPSASMLLIGPAKTVYSGEVEYDAQG